MRFPVAVVQLWRHSFSQQHLRSFSFFSDSQSQASAQDASSKKFVQSDINNLSKSVSIASVLEMIVSRVQKDDSPLMHWAPSESMDPSIWKLVFENKLAIEPRPDTSFCEWLDYVDMVSPTTVARDSAVVVRKVIQMLDANHEAGLDWINIKLSFANVVHILSNLKTPTAAFLFYKWIKGRPYYVPDKSVYMALLDRLVTLTDNDTWDQVHYVMGDMIERKMAADSKVFGDLLTLVKAAKPNTSRLQLYLEWFLKMRPLGLEPWFSTYERVMKMCNKVEMFDSTIIIFKSIPANAYCWAYRMAFIACKCTGNLDLAEELLEEMKLKKVSVDGKCFNALLATHAIHGDADRARNLLEELENSGVLVDLESLNYAQMTTYAKGSNVLKNVVKQLNINQDAQLDWINIELSIEDVVSVMTNITNPTAAFVFYKWVRERSWYVPDRAVYTALINRIIALDTTLRWDHLSSVMMDMIERNIAADSQQFGRLLTLVRTTRPINTVRLQVCVEWLMKMRPLGLELLFSTYEILMRNCNKLGMFDSTIAIFKSMPANSYCWAFRLAFNACKSLDNLDLAEEIFREMRVQKMKLDAKCCKILLFIYAKHGHADKAKSLFEEMKNSGLVVDLKPHTSVIQAFGIVGRVKEAEELFRSIKQELDHSICEAMTACYRNAGRFDDLLAFLKQGDGPQIGASCFVSAFEACVERTEWKIAVKIIKDMQKWEMSPSPALYPLVLLACSKVDDYSACEAINFNLKEMDTLTMEDLERVIKMYVSLEKVPCVIDALTVMDERGFGPPTADLFEYCIAALSRTSMTDAMELYYIMQSVGYLPSSGLLSTLIEKHIVAEEQPSKEAHDDRGNGSSGSFKLEELIASLVLPACKT
ncbi:hypothetical protein L7F22_047103 [Adiantum nelumboides]|nr:hypothetical protein [Adiantum nelumboides]